MTARRRLPGAVVGLVIAGLVPSPGAAQTTDIWLVELGGQAGARVVERITDRDGYDNQPAFTADGRALLFTSDRAGGQTDLFRVGLDGSSPVNLTDTPGQNEYSPRPLGGERMMYILQEGVPFQSLWERPLEGDGTPSRVLTSYVPAAYYARNEAGVLFWGRYTYALFFEPAGARVGPGDGESLFVVGPAGRSLHAIPGSDAFSFVHKQANQAWVIKRYDPGDGSITPLVGIPVTNEDYCWTPDGTLLRAEGRSLQRARPGEGAGWEPVAELDAPGLGSGGRCDVSPDGRYLALVATRP